MKSRLFGSSRSLRAAALFALMPVIAKSPAAASFSSCVAGLKEAAVRASVSRSVASRALDIAQPDEKVLRLSEVQPEFKTPIWDYPRARRQVRAGRVPRPFIPPLPDPARRSRLKSSSPSEPTSYHPR
jgi:membrane-bound lytic murein transglycosylase B